MHRGILLLMTVLQSFLALLPVVQGRGSPGSVGGVKGCASFASPASMPAAPPADLVITANINYQWVVNGQVQPLLTLIRGRTYLLDLTAFGDEHPFLINDRSNNPFGTIHLQPAYGQLLSFTPTAAMPADLWYHCSVHYGMTGPIALVNNCAGDINNDLVVNSTDFGLFVAAFGGSCIGCKSDMNDNGTVNSTDFGLFVAAFGTNCN